MPKATAVELPHPRFELPLQLTELMEMNPADEIPDLPEFNQWTQILELDDEPIPPAIRKVLYLLAKTKVDLRRRTQVILKLMLISHLFFGALIAATIYYLLTVA